MRYKQQVVARLRKAETARKSTPQSIIQISVDQDSDIERTLVSLLLQLKLMGDWGCSRGIKIEDWNPDDYVHGNTAKDERLRAALKNSFGVDGDGSDHIISLKLNGKEVTPESLS